MGYNRRYMAGVWLFSAPVGSELVQAKFFKIENLTKFLNQKLVQREIIGTPRVKSIMKIAGF